jgi:cadmium resistance protein CadD (predicted permease)
VVIVEIIGLGIVAFVATNIDDLFILMVFFARRNFPTYQIVLGQYVGMGLLPWGQSRRVARCIGYTKQSDRVS